MLSFVFIGKIHEKNSPELLLIINIFHSKTGTFCPYLRLDIANQNKIKLFFNDKGKRNPIPQIVYLINIKFIQVKSLFKMMEMKDLK